MFASEKLCCCACQSGMSPDGVMAPVEAGTPVILQLGLVCERQPRVGIELALADGVPCGRDACCPRVFGGPCVTPEARAA